MDFSLVSDWDLQSLPPLLNPYMPEGIVALEAYEAPEKGSALRWLHIDGRMTVTGGHNAAFYNDFFLRPEILVTRRGKKGDRIDNIAPAIGRAVFADTEDGVHADLILHAQEPTLSPDAMMAALGENAPGYSVFTRLEAFREDMTPFR